MVKIATEVTEDTEEKFVPTKNLSAEFLIPIAMGFFNVTLCGLCVLCGYFECGKLSG